MSRLSFPFLPSLPVSLPIPRNLWRGNNPAKLLLIFFVLFFYFSFPFGPSNHASVLSNPSYRQKLGEAQLPELVNVYEQARLQLLDARKFNSTNASRKLGAPLKLPDGTTNLDPDQGVYLGRLRNFVEKYLQSAPAHIQIGGANTLKNFVKHLPTKHQRGKFPARVWSNHPGGLDDVEPAFDLWEKLLPLPLPPALSDQLSVDKEVEWLKPAREGQEWDVQMLDNDGLDAVMSRWTGQTMDRNVIGDSQWGQLWGKLQHDVLRSDMFKYVSMLVEGGIYSVSNITPIAHPYMWGVHAPSILHSDMEILSNLIYSTTLPKMPPNTRPPRVEGRSFSDNETYTPPYSGLERRAPVYTISNPNPATILNPSISLVVAIERDSQIGGTMGTWKQWSWSRFKNSWKDGIHPRSIMMAHNLLVAKAFHPIMMDTVATIAQSVERDNDLSTYPLELTGPGPFTDAVFRYLLVQYGVTPDDLRALRGPVRVGDILVLQEEALHAPEKAMKKLSSYIDSLHLKLGTNRHGRFSPWVFGIGWKDWKSEGVKVTYQG